MIVGAIEIYETYNAGAVTGIFLQTPSGHWQCVYQAQAVVIQESRIFRPQIMATDFPTNHVRLELDCTAANDYCEIDAVKILPSLALTSKCPVSTRLSTQI